VNSVASFRQKRVARGLESGVSEMREGFLGERGGFVLTLRNVAVRKALLRALRNLKREDPKT
jgi:hypothetical protein